MPKTQKFELPDDWIIDRKIHPPKPVKGPRAPAPDAPGGMPEWDPVEKKRWEDEEEEHRKDRERDSDSGPVVINFFDKKE